MKAILFAALIFATASASGTAQRNGKGDRLPLVPALHPLPVKQPVKIETLRTLPRDQELAEGCESLASSLSRSSLANIGGRCLS